MTSTKESLPEVAYIRTCPPGICKVGPGTECTCLAVSVKDYDRAFTEGRRAGLEEAAKVAEQYWKGGHNMYARHSGRAVESRIRALAGGEGK